MKIADVLLFILLKNIYFIKKLELVIKKYNSLVVLSLGLMTLLSKPYFSLFALY